MYNTPTRTREHAFYSQGYNCYYCKCRMWSGDPIRFCSEYGLTLRQASSFRLTAEHVVARCDGGSNAPSNIVAACSRCNRLRHARKRPMPAPQFAAYVRRRVQRGGWHELDAIRAGLVEPTRGCQRGNRCQRTQAKKKAPHGHLPIAT